MMINSKVTSPPPIYMNVLLPRIFERLGHSDPTHQPIGAPGRGVGGLNQNSRRVISTVTLTITAAMIA